MRCTCRQRDKQLHYHSAYHDCACEHRSRPSCHLTFYRPFFKVVVQNINLSIWTEPFDPNLRLSAYVAGTNLVLDQSSNHASNMAHFAVNAMQVIKKFHVFFKCSSKCINRDRFYTGKQAAASTLIDEERPDLGCISIRIGIASGPVTASIVGTRNPKY